jgi:hypothetical protein
MSYFAKPRISQDGYDIKAGGAPDEIWRLRIPQGGVRHVALCFARGQIVRSNNPNVVQAADISETGSRDVDVRTLTVYGRSPGFTVLDCVPPGSDSPWGSVQVQVVANMSTSQAPSLGEAKLSDDAKNADFGRYVDAFVECLYDLNYKYEQYPNVSFYYSPFLRLRYYDRVWLELNIETDFSKAILSPPAARDAMAQARYGRNGRLFPTHLTALTVPNLWAMRSDAFRLQNEDVKLFSDVAMAGVAFVLSTPAMPAGEVSEFTVSNARVTRRRVPGVVRSDGRKLLPRIALTTQEQISALAREHPGLTPVNAERALRGPDGAIATLSGAERSGAAQLGKAADIEFRQLTPDGNVVLRREVKVWTGTQGRFDAAVSDAADQLVAGGGGGEVLIQAPSGTNARSVVQRFKSAGGLSREQQAARLGRYRSIKLTIVDESGSVLLDEPLEFPPLRTE